MRHTGIIESEQQVFELVREFFGTDTRASIRVPAALSGTVGFKPTYGRVPTAGVVTLPPATGSHS